MDNVDPMPPPSWRLFLHIATYVMALVGPVVAVALVWATCKVKRRGAILTAVTCGVLLAYGWVAFMGQFLAAMGGMPFLGPGFEWPMLFTDGAVRDSLGRSYVPHSGAGRIQVYDEKGRFLRGWFLPGGGAAFKLHVTEDDKLEVFIAGRHWHLVYSADGKLLAKGHYSPDEGYEALPTGPRSDIKLAPAWYLLPLTSPVLAWLVGVAGGAGMVIQSRVRRRSAQGETAQDGESAGASSPPVS